MGFFDWLLGRKKDPYATPGRHQPQPNEARGGPVPRNPPHIQNLPARGQRNSFLSWRRRRSREPVPFIRDQRLNDNRRPLDTMGGTREYPDRHYDAGRVASHGLPPITDLDALAAMLGIERNQVIWLTMQPDESTTGSHYRLFEVRKKSGGTRVLAAPLPRLKSAQRALLEKLVTKLPIHSAAHGFRRGRDILTGASAHVGKDVLVSVDIKDFFPTFTFRRVSGYFRWMGYGRGIANTLASLMTARLNEAASLQGTKWKPAYALKHPDLRWSHPQLPQGAPTSPGIANAICWRMDKRLNALARKFGGDYTRYADDITFSGGEDMARSAPKLLGIVREIVRTEGLELNEAKTRVMRRGRQQRVTGVVVNEKTNVSRRDFDRLKAILHNCVKHGPASQNRENVPDFREHLRGRIAHVTHIGPERGRKLMRMFERIVW